jgi:hypothetical protein
MLVSLNGYCFNAFQFIIKHALAGNEMDSQNLPKLGSQSKG